MGKEIDIETLDAVLELCAFVKTNEYPKEHSQEFNVLTNLFDRLETRLRIEGIIPKGRWPKP